ncbi:class I SAM-dependent methyltransferase [Cereibacter changlensis]|uniref:Methyltransferase type 11 domain-containing protein n=2 Tax=Cereibacter changlensis TaxID=402884 RepID=A0A2T4JNV0_9RHOB|nr:class I SAM-dependent methyltransferase [Cereibacter changlensis]PTE19566.1 hypothetical protein C5F48_22230 [Cereibacter changlensis JA139]PZX48633.1 methyltransferase family protein [Cereibacter changlensis]TKA95656.1 class I SAM-dependent methyltransferase [Cereibacter changlensis]
MIRSQSEANERLSFREFECHGWEERVTEYDRSWGHVTRAFIPAILRTLPRIEGCRLLDLATGPGYAAGAAAACGADAQGVDFSAHMVAQARSAYPDATFHIADVLDLPFEGSAFDAVVSNFGVQHFADPAAVFAEAARVLQPGGMLTFTLWAERTRNAAALILETAVERHAVIPSPVPEGPDYHHLLSLSELRATLGRAGLDTTTVSSRLQIVPWRLKTPDELFQAEFSGSVRSGAQLRCQPAAALENIRHAMAADISVNYRESSSFIVPMAAYVISASKP